MPDSPMKTAPKWQNPSDVMKLHKLKVKKKQLQARISGNTPAKLVKTTKSAFEDVLQARKRKNPFLVENSSNKKCRNDNILDESTDQTLFKLLHQSEPKITNQSFTSFDNILSKINRVEIETVVEVKAKGENWLPIDWTLSYKARLLSEKPFPWKAKLKINEEASGLTGFTRCLNPNSETTIDTSPNARFHQCCLYWQQPALPWLKLFPRTIAKSSIPSVATNPTIRDSLQIAWSDGLRSLFQLIRTRQCPFFYACANNFTVLFRAAGICGYTDVHAMITPTTRGFRHMLRQECIEFTMPLKQKRYSDQGYETGNSEGASTSVEAEDEEEAPDEQWLESMGVDKEDIKQINYTQEKIIHKAECRVDNSEQSLVLVEGVEVNALNNFLINCKSATATTGPLAGIPPTLIAPVAFQGASLNSFKVRESKVHIDGTDCYSLELNGPILPHTMHNLFSANHPEHSMTIMFNNVSNTQCFSKVSRNNSQSEDATTGCSVFGKENLSDCGLNAKVLQHFCTTDSKHVTNVECLKYTSENRTYTWN